MSTDFLQVALVAARASMLERADPLSRFTTIAPDGRHHLGQERLIAEVSQGIEAYARTPNIGGKTKIGAALAVACARGTERLCDLALPLRGRTVGAILSPSWPQQIEAAQQAVLKMLGDWPHHSMPNHQVPGALQLILVKPENWRGNPDCDVRTKLEEWSRMWFHVSRIPGGRLDWIWADEPPDMEAWREARNRSVPGQAFLSWITATPIKRVQWEPLKRDFELAQGHVANGRIEIRWGLRDNPFLSEADIQRQYEKNTNDPEAEARLSGEYVDATGGCPFPKELLNRMADGCREPDIIRQEVWTEYESQDGRHREPLSLEFERWYEVEYDESYYVVIDPSLGIDDGEHDPGGLHVYSRVRPRLVARYHGFQTPFALGWLGAKLAQQYRPDDAAYFDVEMNNGFGDTCIRAARECGHDRFQFDVHEDRITGVLEDRIGWTTTVANRGAFIGAVQRVLLDGSVIVRSSGVVDTLRAVRVQPSGRREGPRDEDMILLGRFGHIAGILGTPTAKAAPGFREALERELGKPLIDQRQADLPASELDSIFEGAALDWGPSQP